MKKKPSLLFYILLQKRPSQKPLQFLENSTSPGGQRNVKKYTIIGKKALNNFKKHPTTEKLNIYKIEHARARRVFRESMKNTWRNYVSKLNDRTPIKQTWDMIRKITGKGQSNGIKQIVKDGQTITNIKQISNTLGDTLSSNSSPTNYSNAFQNHKLQQEQVPLNFESDNIEDYNLPFTLHLHSLNKAHDTSVGPDDIHYQILKHMPDISLHALLDLFNDIWDDGVFPPKDHTNPTNYRPISLTSCICKTFERMVNNRLIWYLEYNAIITAYQSGFRKKR